MDNQPILVNGFWLWPSGLSLRAIMGAAEDEEDDPKPDEPETQDDPKPDAGGDGDPKPEMTLEQARAELKRVRDESAKHRVKNKETAEQLAKAEAKFAAVAKAIGLEGEDADPDKLKAELARKDSLLKTERLRNATFRVASKQDADPELTWGLLSSAGDIGDIDTDGADLDAQIEERVKAAIEAHPNLKNAARAAASGPDNNNRDPKDVVDMNRLIRQKAGR